ncbi:MAG: hypothetical protein DA330_09605 [Nitrososphaera sp.]|nr:hypothetical protein [Nitrososphaera sp.]
MITPVTFPNVEGTFQVACNEVLNPFFSGGFYGLVQGIQTSISQVDIHYNIDQVGAGTLPRFCLVGTRNLDILQAKCETPEHSLLRVRKLSLRKTAYLSMPKQGPIRVKNGAENKQFVASWDLLLQFWASFSLIFHSQQSGFRLRGILNPRLSMTPVQVPDKEYFVGLGGFDCNVQVSYQEE